MRLTIISQDNTILTPAASHVQRKRTASVDNVGSAPPKKKMNSQAPSVAAVSAVADTIRDLGSSLQKA
ncbi:hypothetical protein ACEPAG_6739 [Sanghuangporus baumii]